MRAGLLLIAGCGLLLLPLSLHAAGEGQADLDQATDLQISAETLAELEKVATLCESAMKKGLDKGQEEFARQLLSSTLFQHADRLAKSIFEQQPPTPRWPLVRDRAMKDLARAIEVNPKLPDAHLLSAKLQRLPGGDAQAAAKSVGEAIKLFKAQDAVKQMSQALVLRAQLSEDPDQQLADLTAALEADGENVEAWQLRAVVHLAKGDSEKAIADLTKLVEKNAGNIAAQGAFAEALTNLKRYDEALAHINKVVELNPRSSLGYNLRARVHVLKDDLPAALGDLNQALKLEPRDVGTLLLRSRVLAAQDKADEARADVDRALQLRPDLPQAVLMRSLLAAQRKKFAEAIADIQLLLRSDPKNVEYRLQLAGYLVADSRPRRAIELLTNVLADEPQEADALRARGDAYLSIGKQAEAIADYEAALKLEPEDTGVLNNLAWTLATSPDDKLRNAQRSIELATKACELTEYKRPHILSTLASGYAEKGDFDSALKWSQKAVEAGGDDLKEQLQKELDSYKAKKPWRERQSVEENTKPLEPKSGDLET